jgi:translocation and assembly module TamA
VNPDAASARLSVTIDSGPPFRIGALDVRGTERLPADFVERYYTLESGEAFDQERLLALQSRLQNLPQLASVSVDIPRDRSLAEAVPVRIRVSEAESRRLALGAGYSTNTGVRAEVGWRDVNFLSRGWELQTGLRLEQKRQALFADVFLPPTRANVRDSFGALAEATDIEGLRTDRYAIGAVRAWTRGDDETALSLRYQRERLRPDGGDEAINKALTASVSWTRRRINDALDPRRGYVLRGEIGGGAKSVLSDQDFLRIYGRAARYVPIGEDTLILRGELGATLADSREGIPLDYLFRAGGSQSVRGYAYDSLGVQEGDATLGGRYLATASAEYIHWFRPQWGVATFVDIGDAADSRQDFDAKLGVGVGARWRSPAGPIALDLAWGHDKQKLRLHFSVAVAF